MRPKLVWFYLGSLIETQRMNFTVPKSNIDEYSNGTKCSDRFVMHLKVARKKFEPSFFQKQPPEVFYKKNVLKNFAIFTGKHLCSSLFLIELQASRPLTLLQRDSNTDVFL